MATPNKVAKKSFTAKSAGTAEDPFLENVRKDELNGSEVSRDFLYFIKSKLYSLFVTKFR